MFYRNASFAYSIVTEGKKEVVASKATTSSDIYIRII